MWVVPCASKRVKIDLLRGDPPVSSGGIRDNTVSLKHVVDLLGFVLGVKAFWELIEEDIDLAAFRFLATKCNSFVDLAVVANADRYAICFVDVWHMDRRLTA